MDLRKKILSKNLIMNRMESIGGNNEKKY